VAPYAQFIIASSEYLHLSYMQNRVFESLNSLNDLSTGEIARRFASLSLERRKNRTETAITVVVYDTWKTTPFLNGSAVQCDSLVGLLNTDAEMATIHYYDWLDNPGLFHKGAEEGVTVFYQPPEFGRLQKKKHRSGWEGWSVTSEE
jgi:hypothetical protein